MAVWPCGRVVWWYGGVAEWLTRRVSSFVRSSSVGSNPVPGTTTHKPTVNAAVHPSEVGK